MARRNISIPDELDARMEKFGNENWSGVAQAAFSTRVGQLELRSNNMTAIERLRASKADWIKTLADRGYDAGKVWAETEATYEDLRNLQIAAQTMSAAELHDNPQLLADAIEIDTENLFEGFKELEYSDGDFLERWVDGALGVLETVEAGDIPS